MRGGDLIASHRRWSIRQRCRSVSWRRTTASPRSRSPPLRVRLRRRRRGDGPAHPARREPADPMAHASRLCGCSSSGVRSRKEYAQGSGIRKTYEAGSGFVDPGFGNTHQATAGPAGAEIYALYVFPPARITSSPPRRTRSARSDARGARVSVLTIDGSGGAGSPKPPPSPRLRRIRRPSR